MSNLVRCDSCHGRKRVLGMGGMQKPCEPCGAVGWKTVEDMPIVTEGVKNANGNPIVVKKKPGRKPRTHEMNLEI